MEKIEAGHDANQRKNDINIFTTNRLVRIYDHVHDPTELMADAFRSLGLPQEIIRGISELGIEQPTEVQSRAIPFLMKSGSDLCAQAQTGTGKTAAFGLPLITKIDPKRGEIQGLIIAPTRELAKQIGKQLFRFTKYLEHKIFVEVLAGGEPMDRQISNLRRPTHIVVATPGRLLDLLKRNALTLDAVKHLILDEADEMLSMGFMKDLKAIATATKSRRSTWLFSATFPNSIQSLIKHAMSGQPEMLRVSGGNVVNRNISHRYVVCTRDEKDELLANLLDSKKNQRGLIFVRTKAGAVSLNKKLQNLSFTTDVIQGDMAQRERDKVMRGFKNGRVQILIATDVAARGIDVDDLGYVVHFQLPDELEYYTHRSGRTARAGKKGTSIAFIDSRERKKITRIEQALNIQFQEI